MAVSCSATKIKFLPFGRISRAKICFSNNFLLKKKWLHEEEEVLFALITWGILLPQSSRSWKPDYSYGHWMFNVQNGTTQTLYYVIYQLSSWGAIIFKTKTKTFNSWCKSLKKNVADLPLLWSHRTIASFQRRVLLSRKSVTICCNSRPVVTRGNMITGQRLMRGQLSPE